MTDTNAVTQAETFESVVAWGDATFGPCTPARAVSRAKEEWQEMERETPGSEQHAIEAADVIICLLRIPGILHAVNTKMTKNRARQWNVLPDGTGYHVGGSGPPKSSPTLSGEQEGYVLREALEEGASNFDAIYHDGFDHAVPLVDRVASMQSTAVAAARRVRAALAASPQSNQDLEQRIAKLLTDDPACGGRVTTGTIRAIVSEVHRVAEDRRMP